MWYYLFSFYIFVLILILPFWQGNKIQATILGRSLYERMGGVFHEGNTYFIANFEVVKNTHAYRATTHPFKIMLTARTFIRNDVVNLPTDAYSFMPLSDVINCGVDNFPDHLIGCPAFALVFIGSFCCYPFLMLCYHFSLQMYLLF